MNFLRWVSIRVSFSIMLPNYIVIALGPQTLVVTLGGGGGFSCLPGNQGFLRITQSLSGGRGLVRTLALSPVLP